MSEQRLREKAQGPLLGVHGLEVAVRPGIALGRAHRPAAFSEGNGSSVKVVGWK